MKRVESKIIISIIFLFFMSLVSVHSSAAGGEDYFNRGVAYLLIQDSSKANENMKQYFDMNPDPLLKSGFMLLIKGSSEEATNRFTDFLNINQRSTKGVLGIAMATANMEVTNTMELLARSIRQDSTFSAAYLCLGKEYLKRKNYPQAEYNLNRALAIARLPEYKILLAQYYLDTMKPAEVIRLLKAEADNAPENFYYSFLTARAFYMLGQLGETGKYIEAAVKIEPQNNEAQLLLAKYFVGVNDLKKARIILKGTKFEGYHKEYVKTYAHVLTELKDRNAKNYLYESFFHEKWDKDTNILMGRYHLGQKVKTNVQNWINRAILSGADKAKLQELFPGDYEFPDYPYLPFFNITTIRWISDDLLFAAGSQYSGGRQEIFVIDWETKKVLRTLNIRGELQDVVISPLREDDNLNIILSTVHEENKSIYIYAVKKIGKNFDIRPIFNSPQAMPAIHAAFNPDGSRAYFTDAKISSVAFESPFSIVSTYGDKKPVYPVYPFNVYLYDFYEGTTRKVSEPDHFRRVPIKAVRKYILLADAYQDNDQVRNLITKGQRLDLTSDEVVRTYFGGNLDTVIIYLADLKDAFQAIIYDGTSNKIQKVDESMFLGKDEYAAVKILDFRPKEKKLVLMTNDSNRQLIKFNYESYLYHILGKKLIDFSADSSESTFYVLTERNKQKFYTESNLEIFSFEPYVRWRVDTRKDLNKIIRCAQFGEVYFTTNDGESLRMDDQNTFHYVGPSFEGSVSAAAESKKRRVSFINGRLYFIDIKPPKLVSKKTE